MRILFFLLLGTLFSCQKNKNEIIQNQSEVLRISFQKKNCTEFFNAFPDSYKNFDDLYGYDDESGKKQLYDSYEKHINYFFECKECVAENRFYDKIFKIAKSSKWEADAIALFQTNLSNLIINQPSSFVKLLNAKNKIETGKFWHFIFDGSSKNDRQNKEKFEIIYNKIYNLDKNQSNLLEQEFKKM